jgi:tryptophan synthase alpha chain
VRLEARLRVARDSGRKLLVPYVTGGLGGERWTDVVAAFADGGADAIEVGIPFSDPVMDGPTIQAASLTALRQGATPASILDDLRRIEVGVPLVVMTYCNIAFRAGARRFAAELADAGVDGIILPDVPMEEMATWEPAALANDVETVLLASPLTPDARLATLCTRSKGFVYGVNLLGVTGERAEVAASSTVLAKRLKATTDLPVVMGFGISTPEQAAEAAAPADGVVVASALMRRYLNGAGAEELRQVCAAFRAGLDA